MQEKYEQAIKESFEYLDDCLSNQPLQNTLEHLYSLGVDKCYVIERQMQLRGFEVFCNFHKDGNSIYVFPTIQELPIHIWRNKYVY